MSLALSRSATATTREGTTEMTAWVFRDEGTGTEVLVTVYLDEQDEHGARRVVPEVGCVATRPIGGGSWGPPLREVGER